MKKLLFLLICMLSLPTLANTVNGALGDEGIRPAATDVYKVTCGAGANGVVSWVLDDVADKNTRVSTQVFRAGLSSRNEFDPIDSDAYYSMGSGVAGADTSIYYVTVTKEEYLGDFPQNEAGREFYVDLIGCTSNIEDLGIGTLLPVATTITQTQDQ